MQWTSRMAELLCESTLLPPFLSLHLYLFFPRTTRIDTFPRHPLTYLTCVVVSGTGLQHRTFLEQVQLRDQPTHTLYYDVVCGLTSENPHGSRSEHRHNRLTRGHASVLGESSYLPTRAVRPHRYFTREKLYGDHAYLPTHALPGTEKGLWWYQALALRDSAGNFVDNHKVVPAYECAMQCPVRMHKTVRAYGCAAVLTRVYDSSRLQMRYPMSGTDADYAGCESAHHGGRQLQDDTPGYLPPSASAATLPPRAASAIQCPLASQTHRFATRCSCPPYLLALPLSNAFAFAMRYAIIGTELASGGMRPSACASRHVLFRLSSVVC
eukprot:2129717-Rhodomonas_salina.3